MAIRSIDEVSGCNRCYLVSFRTSRIKLFSDDERSEQLRYGPSCVLEIGWREKFANSTGREGNFYVAPRCESSKIASPLSKVDEN